MNQTKYLYVNSSKRAFIKHGDYVRSDCWTCVGKVTDAKVADYIALGFKEWSKHYEP